jgi:hypothetical protein
MRCDARDAAQCLHDHVRPWLRGAKPAGKDSYRAVAPCHDDGLPSLSISAGDHGLIIWNCFARCPSRRTRKALIEAGVSPACLPRTAAELRELEDALEAVTFDREVSHAHARLRLAGLLRGYDSLPAGDALETLAGDCGVSVRSAYGARGARVNR